MNVHFSGSSIGIMILVAIVCTLLPLIYLGYFRAKTGAKISSFFIGIGFSILFSFIGESIINMIFIYGLHFDTLLNVSVHPVYASIYSAIVAGVAAEIGSFVGLKFCMKKRPGKENAFAFGLGKGGFECIIYGGIVYITNIMMAFVINAYGLEDYLSKISIPAEQLDTQRKSIAALAAVTSNTRLLDGTQRILALCLSTALAVLVYMAVTYKPYRRLFPIAIVLHCVGYLPTYLNQAGILTNMTALITISLIYTFAILVYAYRLYHTIPSSPNKIAV